jgi:hypothetical protein
MSVGLLAAISYKKETTWGTAVVPDKSVTVRPTGGMTIKENIALIPGVRGQLQKNLTAIKGKVTYEGNFTLDAFADHIAYLWLSAMGTDTPATHAGETIVYDHVFTETNPKPSLTIEQAQAEAVYRFAGSIVSQLKVTGKSGEMIAVEPTFMAKTQATATAITPSFSTVPAFDHSQTVVKIGGSAIGEVESFELTYKNGLEMVHALGSVEPSYASISGGSEVSGKIEVYLDTTTNTRLTNYVAGTAESIEIICTGAATIGTGAHYVLDITIPKAFYTAVTAPITNSHNLLTIEFNGVYDTATSKLLGVTVTNLTATLA